MAKTNVLAGKKIYKSSVCVASNSESLSGQLDEVAKLGKSGLFGACLYKPPPELAQFLFSVFCFCFCFLFLFSVSVSVYTNRPLSWHNFYLRHFKITLPLTFTYMSLFLRRESVVLFSWPNSKILRPRPTTHFVCLHSVQRSAQWYIQMCDFSMLIGCWITLPLNPV